MFGALTPGFRSLATLKLVVNVVPNFKRQRTAASLRGFLAADGFLVIFNVYIKRSFYFYGTFLCFYQK